MNAACVEAFQLSSLKSSMFRKTLKSQEVPLPLSPLKPDSIPKSREFPSQLAKTLILCNACNDVLNEWYWFILDSLIGKVQNLTVVLEESIVVRVARPACSPSPACSDNDLILVFTGVVQNSLHCGSWEGA